MLKSKTGWRRDRHGRDRNGTDAYSFSALPAGYRLDNGNFQGEGKIAHFWTSSGSSSDPSYMCLGCYSDSDRASLTGLFRYSGLSVRCVKD